MQKIVGFLSNKLTLRGTEVAMYDYAHYNEVLLNNKSVIISRDYNLISHEFDVSKEAYLKFQQRFPIEYYQSQRDIDNIVEKYKITHLYISKSGQYDGLISTKCINLVHCIFNTTQPHGEIYSALSSDINNRFNTNCPVVPYMIYNHATTENLRKELNIPEDAIVFGRHGGVETFDIPFLHKAIEKIVETRSDIYFLFMNTNVFYKHPHIIYVKGTTNMEYKKKFINTSDALIHGRKDGETFGLTCGEFAIEKKPVITWVDAREKNHLDVLKEKAVLYSDCESAYTILNEFTKDKYSMEENGFLYYSPENVMKIFNTIYLQ